MPRVYNKHHGDAPVGAVYVGRGSGFGNPFSHLKSSKALWKVNTREEAVEAYRTWVLDPARAVLYYKIREELKGKDLVCFCAPKPCHADILLQIANGDQRDE